MLWSFALLHQQAMSTFIKASEEWRASSEDGTIPPAGTVFIKLLRGSAHMSAGDDVAALGMFVVRMRLGWCLSVCACAR